MCNVHVNITYLGATCIEPFVFVTLLREYVPVDPKELANRIFVTCYMGSENSSEDTRSRAKNLAQDVGSYHMGKIELWVGH